MIFHFETRTEKGGMKSMKFILALTLGHSFDYTKFLEQCDFYSFTRKNRLPLLYLSSNETHQR